jgi:hypothetical protein
MIVMLTVAARQQTIPAGSVSIFKGLKEID